VTGPQGAALRPPTLLEVERLELADATTAAALTLAAQGFSVFPVDHPWWAKCRGAHGSAACDGKRGKHPTVPWSTRATTDPAAVNRMFGEGRFNIGIACGPSGLLVVDQDGPRDLEVFAADIGVVIPNTRRSRTGRGTHVLFHQDHSRQPVGNAEGRLGGYDVNIRGNGGFIVGPGSMHQDGEHYAFLNPTTPICVAPEWLIEAVTASPASPRAPLAGVGGAAASQLPGGPIQQGRRHLSMLSYAGKLANTNLSLAELTPIFLKRWADCTQPTGAVPGARFEDPACTEVYSQEEALDLLRDTLGRYQEPPVVDAVQAFEEATPTPLVRARADTEFPVDALPGPLAAMVAGVAEFTQTDPAMAGTTGLTVIAAAAGGRAEVQVRPGWVEPVNLYTATVAGPGERKSAVQAVMTAPLREAESQLAVAARDQVRAAVTTKEIATKVAEAARARAVKVGEADGARRAELISQALSAAEAAEAIEVPAIPRLLADDVTPERCAGLMAEQGGRLAVISAEGGIFDIMDGRYSAGVPMLDVWLKGHSGDQLRIDRQSRSSEFIARPALTLGLMIQPSVLSNIAQSRDFRGRGLLARFLYSLPDSKVGRREVTTLSVPPSVSVRYGQAVTNMTLHLADRAEPVQLTLSPSAMQRLDDVARSIEPRLGPDGDLAYIADWGNKYVGAVARIAGLVHLADHPPDGWQHEISQEGMDRAICLGEYFLAQALRAFDHMLTDPVLGDADYLVSVIQRKQCPTVSRRDLHAAASRSRFPRAADLDLPLKMLEDNGYLLREPEAQRGKGQPPSPVWRVHPSLLAA